MTRHERLPRKPAGRLDGCSLAPSVTTVAPMLAIDDPIAIRRAGPGDVSTVLGLLREQYGADFDTIARHEWLYRQNPHGPALTLIGFERASGEPAGQTSVFPRRLSVSGRERLGSIGGDGYVRPHFRRRGIATALHRATLHHMAEAGIELMYGPPEPHNLAALVRAGSRVVCQLRRFVRPLDPNRLAPWGAYLSPMRRWLRPSRSPLKLRQFSPTYERYVDTLWERSASDLSIAPVRDSAFYSWRFSRCPSGKQRAYLILDGGEAIAACALERNGQRTVILDILAPRKAYEMALEAIASFCRDDAALEIRLNERGPIASLLWRQGFVPRDRKAFQVLVRDGHPRAEELCRPRDWYYTTGDGDVESVL